MREPFIRFEKVSKSFGTLTVVDGLDLAIAKGEFVSLLGPSGSGKTTILMMLAGFEKPTNGTIRVDGRRVDGLPPHKRNMGVVFQSYALFPHMSVAENVGFPLKMRGLARAAAGERVKRALDMVQLGGLSERRPAQLSGGQQQRVALARALVFEPEVVLMDEPLGALDKKLRERMQLDIRQLHRRLGLTIVFVTHDQTEALTMSDRIAVLNHGRIEQVGRPVEIYDRPATRFVAEFVGETNFLVGTVKERSGERAVVDLDNGCTFSVQAGNGVQPGAHVGLSVRPERIKLGGRRAPANTIAGAVRDVVYHGDHLQLVLDADGQALLVKADRGDRAPRIGERLEVSFAPDDCWVVCG
jgi:putative spermidine/putrescine transport system ATP-binding protein